MSDGRSWELLKGKQAREVTGSQIEQVGGATFMQPANKGALRQWTEMSNAAEVLMPKSGTIWPDSFATIAAELNNDNLAIYPSILYADEPHADGYMCQLLGLYAYVGSGTSIITVEWNDGTNAVVFEVATVTTSAQLTLLPPSPIYFTEDTKIKVIEVASNACNVRACTAIASRGGNPQ